MGCHPILGHSVVGWDTQSCIGQAGIENGWMDKWMDEEMDE